MSQPSGASDESENHCDQNRFSFSCLFDLSTPFVSCLISPKPSPGRLQADRFTTNQNQFKPCEDVLANLLSVFTLYDFFYRADAEQRKVPTTSCEQKCATPYEPGDQLRHLCLDAKGKIPYQFLFPLSLSWDTYDKRFELILGHLPYRTPRHQPSRQTQKAGSQ